MLDVHPPHAPTHTWKDFFIHIATICVGLLIAVGLEQTVEWVHRRHQVEETRKALAIERRDNINRFAITTEQFDRFIPILQRNLAVFLALKKRPAGPGASQPLDWNVIRFPMTDGAWQTAKLSNVLESMPVAEERGYEATYRRLHTLNDDIDAEVKALADVARFAVADPDVTHLSEQQLDAQIDLTARVLQAFAIAGIDQRNLHRDSPDFTPAPAIEKIQAVMHRSFTPQWMAYNAQMMERVRSFSPDQPTEPSPSK